MTSYTVKVNNKQMSVVTPLTETELLIQLRWKWTRADIEMVKPHNKIKPV